MSFVNDYQASNIFPAKSTTNQRCALVFPRYTYEHSTVAKSKWYRRSEVRPNFLALFLRPGKHCSHFCSILVHKVVVSNFKWLWTPKSHEISSSSPSCFLLRSNSVWIFEHLCAMLGCMWEVPTVKNIAKYFQGLHMTFRTLLLNINFLPRRFN